jgi:hypothetical protein
LKKVSTEKAVYDLRRNRRRMKNPATSPAITAPAEPEINHGLAHDDWATSMLLVVPFALS